MGSYQGYPQPLIFLYSRYICIVTGCRFTLNMFIFQLWHIIFITFFSYKIWTSIFLELKNIGNLRQEATNSRKVLLFASTYLPQSLLDYNIDYWHFLNNIIIYSGVIINAHSNIQRVGICIFHPKHIIIAIREHS